MLSFVLNLHGNFCLRFNKNLSQGSLNVNAHEYIYKYALYFCYQIN